MLSGIVITKNEEKNIISCLKNLERVVDELILIDSESSDKTIELASKFTKKIYIKRFSNNFSSLRNFGLTKAKHSWVIFLDADELLSEKLINEIPNLIKNKKVSGYLIPRRNYISDKEWLKHGLFYPDYQLRLYRKKGVKYKNKVHEYPNIDDSTIVKIEPYIIHRAIRTKYNSFSSIKRLDQYTTIKAEEVLKYPATQIVKENLSLTFHYFINSFLVGRGYKDGWKGFRAAIIYSSFPFIVLIKYFKKRINQVI